MACLRAMTCASLFLLLLVPSTLRAQAFVEHLSPPVLRRGTVNRVSVLGREVTPATGLWTSIPETASGVGRLVSVRVQEAETDRASIDIELSPDAPLGIYGLRLATRSGLSNVHLFVIDELPIVQRDVKLSADAVQPATLPTTVTAVARPATIDRYAIVVTKGQRVAFEVVGNRLGKNYDPLVQIRNSSGKLIAEYDNSVGLMFDCRFAHQFEEAGTYSIEIRDSRFEGDATWHYVLRMGDFPEARTSLPSAVRSGEPTQLSFPQIAGWQFPFTVPNSTRHGEVYETFRLSPDGAASWFPILVTELPVVLEVEPNDSRETATLVTVPASVNGVIGAPGDNDWFGFELAKDQKLNFQGVTRRIGSAADLELILFDPDGREVRRSDDVELDEGGFAFNVGKPGLHKLQVREMGRDGGPEFGYRVDIRAGGPQIQLTAEASDLTVPKGNYQVLPIKVVRTEYNGEIQLELVDAPPGVSLDPAIIPSGSNEVVARLVADKSAPEGIYSFQVVGNGTIETGGTIRAIAKTAPLVDRQLKNVDLIPYALREDQRRLPPSLQEQIALMIAPPAPFSVELPESVFALTRFQSADLSIVTSRDAGFVAPITFAIKGGQIGDEEEERNQVFARFVPGTPDRLTTQGTFFNRINTQLNKHRVDFTATAEFDGRRINLVRAFTMDVRSAFRPTFEPEIINAMPGATVKVKLVANRVPTFDGALQFTLGPQSGLVFPAAVEIPAGQPSIEIEVKVDQKTNLGRHGIRVEVAGLVGKYEESLNLSNIQIDVQKPPQ